MRTAASISRRYCSRIWAESKKSDVNEKVRQIVIRQSAFIIGAVPKEKENDKKGGFSCVFVWIFRKRNNIIEVLRSKKFSSHKGRIRERNVRDCFRVKRTRSL